MECNLFAVFFGIVAGAVGYWFNTFAMQPILRFREVRIRVLSDFFHFNQVVNADVSYAEKQSLYQIEGQRVLATSAELSAAVFDLPRWYLWYAKRRALNPEQAACELIGYSNTKEYDLARKYRVSIRKNLGLPPEDIGY